MRPSNPSPATRAGHALGSWMEELAADAGRAWARDYRARLLLDRRVPAGGWPGTLSEARAVAAACLARAAPSRHFATFQGDLDAAARLVNASARRDWLRSAAPLPREPDDDPGDGSDPSPPSQREDS